MATKLDNRQVVNRSALSMIGSAANDTLDTIFPKIDAELAKLFEDRNISLVDGGIIAFPAAGTSVTFTTNLKLHINSQVAGGSPTVIDLAATTRTLSANLKMIYAVIDRSAGTAIVTDDSSTLPAQTSANQEVVLIAKRVDSGDGTKRVYFRGGFSLSAGQSSRFGTSGILFSSEFAVVDAADTTKKVLTQVSGSATGTQTTLAFAQTANRVLTFPDITDTLVSRTNTETLSNKQVQYSVSTDSTTTGSDATLQSFTTGIVRLTNSSLVSLGGIPAGSAGQFLIVENKTGNSITLQNEDTVATAADRVLTGSGGAVSMANNATFAFTYDSTSSRWQLTGGSGSGSGSGNGKNYLSAITTSQSSTPNTGNGNFELGSTAGWSLFNTTLTNKIPTGSITAGASSLTFGVTSTAPNVLAGTYSLNVTASSSWSAGQGVISDAFYIDQEDYAKVLSFKIAYKNFFSAGNANFSGTSDNTLAVYVYDVTNSQWIQPSGVYGITQSSGVGYVSGAFQTSSNGTQYRIAVLAANASSGSGGMYMDDFTIGPNSLVYGAPLTDWLSYTPTFTGFGTVTDINFVSWREGGFLAVQGTFTAGTTTATEARISLGYNGADGNVTTASTTPANGHNVGTMIGGAPSATFFNTSTILNEPSKSYVTMSVNNSTNNFSKSNGNIYGNNWVGSVFFKVPIEGWSSSVHMSDSTDTRVVSFSGNASGSTTIAASSSDTKVQYNTVTRDTHGAFNTSTNTYTVPVTGWYNIRASVRFDTASWTQANRHEMLLYKNSASSGYMNSWLVPYTGSYYPGSLDGDRTEYFNAGDTIDIRVRQAEGGTRNLITDSSINYISIEKVNGPSAIAATETIAARYQHSSGQTISNAASEIVNFADKIIDTHNAVTTGASWKFTAPASGIYNVSGLIVYGSASFSTNSQIRLDLFKNGIVTQRLGFFRTEAASGADLPSAQGSSIIRLNAGDYIHLEAYQDNGGPRSLQADGTFNWINIHRIGN